MLFSSFWCKAVISFVYCDTVGAHISYTQFPYHHCEQYIQSFHNDLALCSQKLMFFLVIPVWLSWVRTHSPNLPKIILGVCHTKENSVGCKAISGLTKIILRTNYKQSNAKCQNSHLGQFYPKAELVLGIQYDGKPTIAAKKGSFLQLTYTREKKWRCLVLTWCQPPWWEGVLPHGTSQSTGALAFFLFCPNCAWQNYPSCLWSLRTRDISENV